MARFNIHAGHNPKGKIACGAVGFIDESEQARWIKDRLISKVRNAGHTVYDCTCNNGRNKDDVLNKIVAMCNAHKVDLDISIHFNSGAKDQKGDGKTTGIETLVYDTRASIMKYANLNSSNIASLGFKNRGVKVRSELAVLRRTASIAMLIEVCFVDDRDDSELYWQVREQIVDAIYASMMLQTYKANTGTSNTPKPVGPPKVSKGGYYVKVKTKDGSNLNVRKGAGANYEISYVLLNGSIAFVETVHKDNNGNTWYKIRGFGYISASECVGITKPRVVVYDGEPDKTTAEMIAKLHKTKIYPDDGTVDKNKYEIMYVGEGKDRYESDRIASSKFLL